MILVAGSANLDFVVCASHIPLPGETVLGRDFKTFPGGKGANQAVACARAGGVKTQFLSAMGSDAYADLIIRSLTDAQVELHTVRSSDQPTGCAFICLSDDAENAITVAPGANMLLSPEHLPPLAGFSHLLMQLETPLSTVMAYAQAAKAQGVQVVLNAAPAAPLSPELLALVDVLLVNEGELATLAQCQGSVAECLGHIKVSTVIVTLGHQGCCARQSGQLVFHTAYSVVPVDTTAAGDTFCGVLVAALSKGTSLEQALARASAAGALACTQLGAQASIPQHDQVALLMAQQPQQEHDALVALRRYCGLIE